MDSNNTVLAYRDMKMTEPSAPVDVILTPYFYTIKRESIPVRFAYQAKKIAPSVFEGLIDKETSVAYFVYKEENQWIFIAYDIQKILDFLEGKGIPLSKIHKIYFAQQIAGKLNGAVKLGESNALMNLDGNATVVPIEGISVQQWQRLSRDMLPKKGIVPPSRSLGTMNQKQLIALVTVLIGFGLIWFVEGRRYDSENKHLVSLLSTYYTKYPVLVNSYTRSNILKKYQTIDKNERKKRLVIGQIAGMLGRDASLSLFEMDEKRFMAKIAVTKGNAAKQIAHAVSYQKWKFKKLSETLLQIEGKL